jgi:hypothetical protein
MIKLKINSNQFLKEMTSITKYAEGFLEGAQGGKPELLHTVGQRTKEILEQFIDSNARLNPRVLHHIYEWNEAGNTGARLFDLDYFVTGGGLTFKSTFRQSSSVNSGSDVPFYDKARIMEEGIPVTIRPRKSSVLVFEDDGEKVFTKSPVTVRNPGGEFVAGGFQETVDTFFNSYWRQSFLQSSGIADILRNPIEFKQNLPKAKAGGRAMGYDVGYRWISARRAR